MPLILPPLEREFVWGLNSSCPIGCINSNFISTNSGSVVCDNCGCEVDKIIDNTDYGFKVDNDKKTHAYVDDSIRCTEVDELCPNTSLNTYISATTRTDDYRIRNLNIWLGAGCDPLERSLNEDFKTTFELFTQHLYHPSIVSKAKWLYKTFFEYNRQESKEQQLRQTCVRGGQRRAIIGICIYYSGRIHSTTLDMNEIQTLLEVKSSHLRKAKKEFLKIMKDVSCGSALDEKCDDNNGDVVHEKDVVYEKEFVHVKKLMQLLHSNLEASDYIEKFGDRLQLKPFIIEIAISICTALEMESRLLDEYKPQSKAAISLYFAIDHFTILKGLSDTSDNIVNKKATISWMIDKMFPLFKIHCDTSYATIRSLINKTAPIIDGVIVKSVVKYYGVQLKLTEDAIEKLYKITTLIYKLIVANCKVAGVNVYCVICTGLLFTVYNYGLGTSENEIYKLTKTSFKSVQPYISCILPYSKMILKSID